MMAHLFPKRTRAELKAKFKREDRKNSALVSQALANQSFDPMESMTESEESEPEVAPPKRRRSSAIDKADRIQDEAKADKEIEHSAKIPNSTSEKLHAEVPIEKVKHPATIAVTPASPLKAITEGSSDEDLKQNRRPKMKRKQRISQLPGFTRGRPMGLVDGVKLIDGVKLNPCMSAETDETSEEQPSAYQLARNKSGEEKVIKPRGRVTRLSHKRKEAEIRCEPEPADPRPQILRFDASDPLGLKIVPVESTSLEEPSEIVPPADNVVEVSSSPSEISESVSAETEEMRPPPVKHTRRSARKVKPRIPRVPGGGGK